MPERSRRGTRGHDQATANPAQLAAAHERGDHEPGEARRLKVAQRQHRVFAAREGERHGFPGIPRCGAPSIRRRSRQPRLPHQRAASAGCRICSPQACQQQAHGKPHAGIRVNAIAWIPAEALTIGTRRCTSDGMVCASGSAIITRHRTGRQPGRPPAVLGHPDQCEPHHASGDGLRCPCPAGQAQSPAGPVQ